MTLIVVPNIGSFTWESMSCADYIAGRIDVEQLEQEIELILSGQLPQRLFGGLPPAQSR